jgi:hypothetical protein
MTNKEKFTEIQKRLKAKKIDIDEDQLSLMVIIDYLGNLEKDGFIEHGYSVSKVGQDIVAICEEFDWKPDDADIINFVVGMVDKAEQAPVAYMITRYRDNKESLYADMKRAKEEGE